MKTARMAALNRQTLLYARDSAERDKQWEFVCECGRDDCHERVFLTLEAYVALHDGEGAVLAEGHRMSQIERARQLRADAEALRRQAEHQVRRASRNLAERAPVRVLVVDDSEVFRNVLAAVVAATPGFEVVGRASSGEQALGLLETLDPQFVLLDVHMPEMDGIETALQIRRRRPNVIVLLLSASRRAAVDNLTLAVEDKRDLDPEWLADFWRKRDRSR